MEYEVTALDQFSIIGDLMYKIVWIALIVLSAFYVVGSLSVGWIILAAIACCVFKTTVGLFNYSAIMDIVHYYCDLLTGLLVGWGIGNWFNFYKVGFYEFSMTDYILPVVAVIVFSVIKVIVPTKRSYKKLL